MRLQRTLGMATGAVVLSLGFSTAVVFAIDTTTSTEQKPQVLSETNKQKLQERLTARKAEIKPRLTVAQKNRLKNRCKAAQGLLSSVKNRVQGLQKGRSDVYGKIINQLTGLSDKLKNKNITTTELDAAITTLRGKITTFNNDLSSYEQAISDLADMECATDPEAFKASLEVARNELEKVHKDAQDIRAYIKDPLKPILADIRLQLAAATDQPQGSN